ncbi:MAG: hypothetical protein H6745_24195 [Deltaproteobacteria bacterium]|nr:hypothetical protein [Deltaproteobacteria bacterium]
MNPLHRTSRPGAALLWRLGAAGLALSALGAAAGPGCGEKKPDKVVVIREGEDAEAAEPPQQTAEEAHEERLRERENAPEPELNPEEPREQFALVWELGKKDLKSIHQERYDILQRMKDIKFEDEAYEKRNEELIEKLSKFSVGREKEQLETAAERLCAAVTEARTLSDQLIAEGEAEIRKIDEEIKENETKVADGGKVSQKKWDKLEEARTNWSQPIQAGKFAQLAIKSMLDEGYVLADKGPRRAQLKLRDCLGEIAKQPLALDLAQEQLEKVIARAKWYRDLR